MAEGKIVVTLKGGAGYEAPWITVGGDSVDEIKAQLDDLAASVVIADTVYLAELFRGAKVAGPLTVPTTPATATTQAVSSAAAVVTSNGAATTCAHGQRVRRQGTSARGAWTAWFCPQPKGAPDQCKAEFEED